MIAGAAAAALLLPTKVPTYFYGNVESESKTSQKWLKREPVGLSSQTRYKRPVQQFCVGSFRRNFTFEIRSIPISLNLSLNLSFHKWHFSCLMKM